MGKQSLFKHMILSVLALSASAALCSIAWLAAEAAIAVRAIGRTASVIEKTAASLPSIIKDQSELIVSTLDARAASIEQSSMKRIASIERTLDKRLASAEAKIDTRISELLRVADSRLGETASSVQQVASQSAATMSSLDAVLRHTDGVVADVHGSLYPWLDCGTGTIGEGKPCLQQEIWWMTKKANAAATSLTLASEVISDTMRQHGPSTAKSIDGIAASVDKIGKWYTSKRRLFIEGGLLLFNGFWRNKD